MGINICGHRPLSSPQKTPQKVYVLYICENVDIFKLLFTSQSHTLLRSRRNDDIEVSTWHNKLSNTRCTDPPRVTGKSITLC